MSLILPAPSRLWLGGEREDAGLFHSPDALRRELPCHASHGRTYCVAVETEAQLRRLAPLWRTLHAADPAPSPFASWDWAWNWWQYFGKHPRDGASTSHLFVVAVLTESHELIGLFSFHFPIYHSPLRLRWSVAPRPLRAFGSLGRHREAMTEAPILLTKPGESRRALESALHFLLGQQTRFRWDSVELWVEHAERTLMAAPDSSCSPWQTRFQHRRASPVLALALPPSWDTLRASLSKSMRDNLRYYPRLLARHGHTWEVSVASTPEEVAEEVEGLAALHRRREESRASEGKSGGAGGHLPSAVHVGFLQDVLPALAARGDASIAVLRIDGRRVAAQALLRRGGTCVFYYSGFDPAWGAYSPLTILHAEAFTNLISQGVTAVNLLAGEMPWKTRWGAKPAGTLQQLFYIRPSPVAVARLLLYARQKKGTQAAS